MTKTLDDIKQEAVSAFLVEERPNDTQEDRIRRVTIQDTIDYLQAQGLLMVWNTDMDSAPRDGTDIIVNMPQVESGCTFVYWKYGWRLTYDGKPLLPHVKPPIAWMPLPKGGE